MQTSPQNLSKKSKFRLAHRSYAEALRFIGQTLVKFRPEFLEIELSKEVYYVRGRTQEAPRKSDAEHLESLPLSGEAESNGLGPSPVPTFTFQYTTDEIVNLSRAWKAKRSQVGKMPDIQGLAELLRTIGSDLDSSGNSLLKISKKGQELLVLFEERDGNTKTREYDWSFLSKKQKEIASDRMNKAGVEPWKNWDL
jgi:hypothetical protein